MTIHVYCYKVKLPGETVWFYEDFEGAFQYATGCTTRDKDDAQLDVLIEHSEAELTCFGWSR